jgi:hypothetical protein
MREDLERQRETYARAVISHAPSAEAGAIRQKMLQAEAELGQRQKQLLRQRWYSGGGGGGSTDRAHRIVSVPGVTRGGCEQCMEPTECPELTTACDLGFAVVPGSSA